MTRQELRAAYRAGVEMCKGKIPVNGNPPERLATSEFLASVQDAVAAGCEIVNIYGPAGWHGYQPTDAELRAHFDTILTAVKHPVALAPLPVIGYTPKAEFIARLCRDYRQVVAVNLAGMVGESYLLRLMDGLDRDIAINVPWQGSLQRLGLGSSGLLSVEANIIPNTLRRYVDLYDGGDAAAMNRVYADLTRFSDYVMGWKHHSRWIKMAMRALRLPGGEGGAREPFLMPPVEEMRRFTEGLLALGLPEIDQLARKAGLR